MVHGLAYGETHGEFLNEVLSLNAQESLHSRLFRQSDFFLNEVLSLNAQELARPCVVR